MWQFVLSSLRSGLRGRSFLGVFLLGVALVCVAYLSASFSPRQPQTVALDVGLSGLRFALALFAIVSVQELVGREIGSRSVVLTLAYPCSRSAYLMGRYLGVLVLVGLAATILSLLLWIVVMASGLGYEQQFAVRLGLPFWITVLGVWVDAAVIAAFTLCIGALSTVAMLPLMLGVLFAVASRAVGSVFDYVSKGADGQDALAGQFTPVLEVVRWMLPDLSRLDWRIWPMYGIQPDALAIVFGALAAFFYVGAMLGLAVHVFSRREFS